MTRNTSGGWSCTTRWPLVWSPGGSGGRPAMSQWIMLPQALWGHSLVSPASGTKLKYLRQRLGHTWKNLCELILLLCCQQFLYFINIGYLSLFPSTGGFLCWPWTRPTGRREASVFWSVSTRHFCNMSDIILTTRGPDVRRWMLDAYICVCFCVSMYPDPGQALMSAPLRGQAAAHHTATHLPAFATSSLPS